MPSLNVALSRLSRIPIKDVADSTLDNEKIALPRRTQPSSSSSKGRGRSHFGNGFGGGRTTTKREDKYCDFCHVPRHTEDRCWQKHGKPDWAKQLNNLVAFAPTNVSTIRASTTIIGSSNAGNTFTLSHEDFEHLLKMAQADRALLSVAFAQLGNTNMVNLPLHHGLLTQEFLIT